MYSVKYSFGECFKIKKFLKLSFAKEFCKTKQNSQLFLDKPIYQGWIYKKGQYNTKRQLRFVVLTKQRLIYYDVKEDTTLIECGDIELLYIKNIFQYKNKISKFTFIYKNREYDFKVYNDSSDKWVSMITDIRAILHKHIFQK